jgi:S-adenosyl-L-homocysteine hydrolase
LSPPGTRLAATARLVDEPSSFRPARTAPGAVVSRVNQLHMTCRLRSKIICPPRTQDQAAAGVKLTALSAAQARYLDLPSAGPFKPEHYRY